MSIETQVGEVSEVEVARRQAVEDIKNLFSKYDQLENVDFTLKVERKEKDLSSFTLVAQRSFNGERNAYVFENDHYAYRLIDDQTLPGSNRKKILIKITPQEDGLNEIIIRDYCLNIARDRFTKKF